MIDKLCHSQALGQTVQNIGQKYSSYNSVFCSIKPLTHLPQPRQYRIPAFFALQGRELLQQPLALRRMLGLGTDQILEIAIFA